MSVKPDISNVSQFEPQVGHVVLHRWKEDELTAGGLIMPEASQRSLCVGTVLVVGQPDPDRRKCLDLSPGDVVYFCAHSPTELDELGGKKDRILIIAAPDILGRHNYTKGNIHETQSEN